MARSYLVLRNRHFHFRHQVPADLWAIVGKKEWRQSLRTGDEREAARLATTLAAANHALIARLRATIKAEEAERQRLSKRTPGDALREALTKVEVLDAQKNKAKKLVWDRLPVHVEAAAEAARLVDAYEVPPAAVKALEKAKATRVAALRAISPAAAEAEERISPLAGAVKAENEERRDAGRHKNIAALATLRYSEDDEDDESLDDDVVRHQNKAHHAGKRRTAAEKLLAKAGIPPRPEEKKDDPTAISAVFAQWKKAKAVTPARAKKVGVYVRRFVDVVGDIPIASVRKSHVKEFAERIADLPDSTKFDAKTRAASVQHLITLREKDAEEAARISPSDPDEAKTLQPVTRATVTKHLEAVRGVLAWAVGEDLIQANPATGVKAPENAPVNEPIRPYKLNELKILLAAVDKEWEGDDRRLIVWTALYSGARLEEICQLKRGDVRQEMGVWVFDIRRGGGRSVKNKSSVRLVPVHKKLIDLGITERAIEGSADQLFPSLTRGPDGRFGHEFSKSFAWLMSKRDLLPDDRLNFHSLRHTFKDACRNAGVALDMQHWLFGHVGDNKIAHGYGVGPSVRVKNQALQTVDPLREWEEVE